MVGAFRILDILLSVYVSLVHARRLAYHWRVMGAIAQGYCYGYRRIDALKLQGHSHIIFHKIVEVELVGVEPTCRDDFLYESTSQRTNAKIIESNEMCKRNGDYFCSPAHLFLVVSD